MAEIRMMLRDSAWEEVKWIRKWEVEAHEGSTLGVHDAMLRLLVRWSKDRCMDVQCKRLRRILVVLRGVYCCTKNWNWEIEWPEERGEGLYAMHNGRNRG